MLNSQSLGRPPKARNVTATLSCRSRAFATLTPDRNVVVGERSVERADRDIEFGCDLSYREVLVVVEVP